MKVTDKGKSIRTTPKGAWEGGIVNLEKDRQKPRDPDAATTDSQGNGYPTSGQPH